MAHVVSTIRLIVGGTDICIPGFLRSTMTVGIQSLDVQCSTILSLSVGMRIKNISLTKSGAWYWAIYMRTPLLADILKLASFTEFGPRK